MMMRIMMMMMMIDVVDDDDDDDDGSNPSVHSVVQTVPFNLKFAIVDQNPKTL